MPPKQKPKVATAPPDIPLQVQLITTSDNNVEYVRPRVIANQTAMDVAMLYGYGGVVSKVYYELGMKKAEDVSASKDLVMYDCSTSQFYESNVRTRLGFKEGSKMSKIRSSSFPGKLLYIESTSANRQLEPNTFMLIRTQTLNGIEGKAIIPTGAIQPTVISTISSAAVVGQKRKEVEDVKEHASKKSKPTASSGIGLSLGEIFRQYPKGASTSTATTGQGGWSDGAPIARSVKNKSGKDGDDGDGDDGDDGGDGGDGGGGGGGGGDDDGDDEGDGGDGDDGDGGDDDDDGHGSVPSLDPFLIVLPHMCWNKLFELLEGGEPFFPPNSPWANLHQDGGPIPLICDEPISSKRCKVSRKLIRDLRALGNTMHVPSSSSSSSSSSPPTFQHGWIRDRTFEAKIASDLVDREARPDMVMNQPDAPPIVVRAFTHTSVYPASKSIILVDVFATLGGFESDGGTCLIVTNGPEFILIGCVGEHPLVVTNQFSYGNSDGSGPTMLVHQFMIDAGLTSAPLTDIESPMSVLDVVEKYFNEFTMDQHH